MAEPSLQVILGVDTHAQVHVAALLDHLGRLQGALTIPATQAGAQQLLAWAARHGQLTRAGVEGTGTYGAGLARFLTAAGVKSSRSTGPTASVGVAVASPTPPTPRRPLGRSWPVRPPPPPRPAAASSRPSGCSASPAQAPSRRAPRPPTSSATCWSPRPRSCTPSCTRCRPPSASPHLVAQQPGRGADPASATRRALCHLARRHRALTAELDALNADLASLTRKAAPRLLARYGVGVETAGQLLVTAGDNPQRLRSEAALAALCGASPMGASSGKTTRHRLNRGGDRRANNALWVIALTRLRDDPRTRAYAQRRTKQGKTTKDILRCPIGLDEYP
jgi:transposase